jgi:thiamine biosynthesis protein ThiI
MTHTARQYIVVHYGELSLKGKNRSAFIRTLARNIRQALCDLGNNEIKIQSGRLLLTVPATVPWTDLEERLCCVFGVANFAPCLTAPHDLNAIKRVVDKVLGPHRFASWSTRAAHA